MPASRRFVDWIRAHPDRAFAAFAAVHALVWTALPTLLYPNLPLDLIEALMYGREWQLGYDKLPPLPWWLVEIAYRAVGHDFAYYLLAQLAVVAALALVFATARRLVDGASALASVLVVDGLHYVNYTSAKFNHDVIQLPFWALAGFALHRALRGGRWGDWLLLGFAVGMSLWAKYFVVVLVVPMIALALLDRDAHKVLRTPGPYAAALLALIVTAPHLAWLVHNDFLPLAYAEHRAILPRGWYDHFWHPAQFAIGQTFFMLPALAIAAPLFLPPGRERVTPETRADAFDRRIIAWLTFGPMATVLAMSAVTGRGTVAMWGYPLWLFLGLWLVLQTHGTAEDDRLKRLAAIWAVVFVTLAVAFVINYAALPRLDHRYRAVFFPGAALAHEIEARYQAATGAPPAYVIGTMWDGGNVEHYARNHPRNLVDGEPERAPWIDLADLRRRGAVVVWTDGDPQRLPPRFARLAAAARVQPSFVLPYRRGPGVVTVGWAILPPSK